MTVLTPLTFTDHVYKHVQDVPISLRIWPNPKSSGDNPSPILFWTHGGAWLMGASYDVVPWVLESFHERGYTFVSVDYRLMPQATLRDMVNDVQDAYSWVIQNINKEMAAGFADVERIVVGGDSAGGNLATLMGALADPKPKAVLDLYGIVDLIQSPLLNEARPAIPLTGKFSEEKLAAVMASPEETETLANCPFPPNQPNWDKVAKPPGFEFTERYWLQTDLLAYIMRSGGLIHTLLGRGGSNDESSPELARKLSTVHLVEAAETYPPTFVIHGTADSAVEVGQSDRFVQALKDKGIEVQYTRNDGGEHCFDQVWSDKSAPDWKERIDEVHTFLDLHARK